MTTPSIVPTKYAGDDGDFLIAKIDRSGALRMEYVSVSVPSGTATSTVVGLVPFRKGARFIQGATQLYVENIGDGSFTFNVGYVYDDNTTYTNDDDAFASALTTGQAGGLITFDEHAGLSWVADADGWIVATTGGSTTDNTGVIKGQACLAYDG
ncbi:MAG: hypothetical protein M3O22_00295 [Pseudomonadota bacterium]|nr:hypothetical protein [Pseudomonadota bacterium]